MSYPLPFSVLKRRHEAAVEAFCDRQTKMFEERAKVLLRRIQEELPCVHELVSCNGDFWLVGKNMEDVEIEYIWGDDVQHHEPGSIYKDGLNHLFKHFAGYMDKPNVSAKTYKAMKELYELAEYCESETRLHTTASIAVGT